MDNWALFFIVLVATIIIGFVYLGTKVVEENNRMFTDTTKYCASRGYGITHLNRNGYFCVDREGRLIKPTFTKMP